MAVQISFSVTDEKWQELLDETEYGHSELQGKIRDLADQAIEELIE
jgi:hypothetical protein